MLDINYLLEFSKMHFAPVFGNNVCVKKSLSTQLAPYCNILATIFTVVTQKEMGNCCQDCKLLPD